MNKFIKIVGGVVLAINSIWTPAFVGGYLLPSGWTNSVCWWSIPMVFTLVVYGFASIVVGVEIITYATSE